MPNYIVIYRNQDKKPSDNKMRQDNRIINIRGQLNL